MVEGSATVVRLLETGRADVGIFERFEGYEPGAEGRADGLTVRRLVVEPVLVAVSEADPLADQEEIALADLADRDWVVPPPHEDSMRAAFSRRAEAASRCAAWWATRCTVRGQIRRDRQGRRRAVLLRGAGLRRPAGPQSRSAPVVGRTPGGARGDRRRTGAKPQLTSQAGHHRPLWPRGAAVPHRVGTNAEVIHRPGGTRSTAGCKPYG